MSILYNISSKKEGEMVKNKQLMKMDKDMKNWVVRRRFQDFCNENSICSVILIADNPFIVQYFKLLFSGCNCKFMTVHNGEDAILKIEDIGGADIVMVDNDLPDVNSASLRKALRQVWPETKVIDVRSPQVGHGARDVTSAVYRGMRSASYIEKPFDVHSVIKTITSTILD